MSTARATKRPHGQSAPEKARQAHVKRTRAASEKKQGSAVKNKTKTPNRWAKGKSGNPRGRPKGAEGRVTKTAREIFTAFIEGNAARVQELWNKVARNNPAKALAIYAKLAEYVLPKLQRSEIDANVTGSATVWYPSIVGMDVHDASRAYQESLRNPNIEFLPATDEDRKAFAERTYKKMREDGDRNYEKQTGMVLPAARPAPSVEPAPEPAADRPSRFESVQDPEPSEPKPETNIVGLREPRHSGECQPIVDSKCPWCRKLWVSERDARLDAELRHQRAPRVLT